MPVAKSADVANVVAPLFHGVGLFPASASDISKRGEKRVPEGAGAEYGAKFASVISFWVPTCFGTSVAAKITSK